MEGFDVGPLFRRPDDPFDRTARLVLVSFPVRTRSHVAFPASRLTPARARGFGPRSPRTTRSAHRDSPDRRTGVHSNLGSMSSSPATISVGEAPEIQAFLAERIYEFNSKATGYFDGESFSGIQRDDSG